MVRYRLNRGGDRQLNRALHTIVLVRLRDDPATQAYLARRTAEGKSRRDVKRCLRRAVARQRFRLLERYDQPGVEILKASLLGTIKRSDGSMQVTYNQHPLYYYAGDTAAGQLNGQGLNAFGAGWDVLSPSGSKIEGGSS